VPAPTQSGIWTVSAIAWLNKVQGKPVTTKMVVAKNQGPMLEMPPVAEALVAERVAIFQVSTEVSKVGAQATMTSGCREELARPRVA
jgi:hypothetical protein